MPRDAFSRALGTAQGRVQNPSGVVPPEGQSVMVFGFDLQRQTALVMPGDYCEVVQSATLTGGPGTTKVLRMRGRLRGPTVALPNGKQWLLSVLVDGVERTSRLIEPSHTRDVTLDVNVGNLDASAHMLTLRMSLWPWVPTDLTALNAWYIADENQLGLVGSDVDMWFDKYGFFGSSELSAVSAGQRPLWEPNGWRTGKGCVTFQGADLLHNVIGTISNFLSGEDVPFTILATLRLSAVGSTHGVAGWDDANGTLHRISCRVASSNVLAMRTEDSTPANFATVGTAALNTNSHVLGWIRQPQRIIYVVDGHSDDVAHNAAITSVDEFFVGAVNSAGGSGMSAKVREILVLRRAITPAEMAVYRLYAQREHGTLLT